MRQTVRAAAAAFVLALAACGGSPSSSMNTIALSMADTGRSVAVRPGDRMVVTLEENPTTGFRWAVDANNDAVLAPSGDEYVAQGQAPGSGGARRLTFAAASAGQSALRLKHLRSWEGDASIIARFAVTVTVR